MIKGLSSQVPVRGDLSERGAEALQLLLPSLGVFLILSRSWEAKHAAKDWTRGHC